MRTLLVEDHIELSHWLAKALRDAHLTVECADNGADALPHTQDYALLILNLALPRMDGLEVLKRLRALRAARPDAGADNIELSLEAERECVVDGHALLLHELVANLVDNALRYTPAGGAGLGVSIVRDIATLHGAAIALDDPPGGRGLRVTVTFPRA